MEIKIAKMHDAGYLKELNRGLYGDMSKLSPNEFKVGCFDNEFIKEVILSNMSDFILLVDKEPVGYIFIQAKKTFDSKMIIPHTFSEIYDLYIKEEYRKKGYGRQLIDAAINWSKIRGLEYIELNVLSNNSSAINFYQKNDFNEKQKVLKLDI